jgi:CBS domain-containing protein
MSTHVHTVQQSDPLSTVVNVIRNYKIRHIPVMNSGKIVGMISSTDVNRLTFNNLFENQDSADEAILEMLKIEQVMTSHTIDVTVDTLIKDVAEIFSKAKFHALPVVNRDKLVGIVTTTDVIKYLLKQYLTIPETQRGH